MESYYELLPAELVEEVEHYRNHENKKSLRDLADLWLKFVDTGEAEDILPNLNAVLEKHGLRSRFLMEKRKYPDYNRFGVKIHPLDLVSDEVLRDLVETLTYFNIDDLDNYLDYLHGIQKILIANHYPLNFEFDEEGSDVRWWRDSRSDQTIEFKSSY